MPTDLGFNGQLIIKPIYKSNSTKSNNNEVYNLSKSINSIEAINLNKASNISTNTNKNSDAC